MAAVAGVHLAPDRAYLIESRLRPLMRRLGLTTWAELTARLGCEGVRSAVVEAMTTPETYFLRDPWLWDLLAGCLLPTALAANRRHRSLRIWSAGCSTGQEAYSAAMVAVEALEALGEDPDGWRITVLGTDIATGALERARAGVYGSAELERGLDPRRRRRWFVRTSGGWAVRTELASRVRFAAVNLLDRPYGLGHFDVVLLRNVLFHLVPDLRRAVLGAVAGHVVPGGWLVVGATELVVPPPGFRPLPEGRGSVLAAVAGTRDSSRPAAPRRSTREGPPVTGGALPAPAGAGGGSGGHGTPPSGAPTGAPAGGGGEPGGSRMPMGGAA